LVFHNQFLKVLQMRENLWPCTHRTPRGLRQRLAKRAR
jgi:hypothetical protein